MLIIWTRNMQIFGSGYNTPLSMNHIFAYIYTLLNRLHFATRTILCQNLCLKSLDSLVVMAIRKISIVICRKSQGERDVLATTMAVLLARSFPELQQTNISLYTKLLGFLYIAKFKSQDWCRFMCYCCSFSYCVWFFFFFRFHVSMLFFFWNVCIFISLVRVCEILYNFL